MPAQEAPRDELGSTPGTPNIIASLSPSEASSTSSPEPENIPATPLFRVLAMPPPEPDQPPGQDELERRLPGYRRIVIPRELTLIEFLKQCSGVTTDEEVLRIREAKLRVVAERVGLRRLHVLAPRLRSLTLDGSALSSLRDLGIGLVHLKVLSVNRCGLTCLDGVWGLTILRELHAAGNHLRDMHQLAALQKLHTLNLADNPIENSGRLWTLGVCSSLRRLTMKGTPASDLPEYRTSVASVLPLLVYLDDRPLYEDAEGDANEEVLNVESSGSDSDNTDVELETEVKSPPSEPKPGPSSSYMSLQEVPEQSIDIGKGDGDGEDDGDSVCTDIRLATRRRRPATTECAGARPRVAVPPRPRTAQERSPATLKPSTLHALNTLMDEEWRCTGSKLTSHGAVCGNLAQALRRPSAEYRRKVAEEEKELIEQRIGDASRLLAAEIPRVSCLEDWAKFRQDTGIDIEIDFNKRPKGADSTKAIERLERIEKETLERFKEENMKGKNDDPYVVDTSTSNPYSTNFCYDMIDYEPWREMENVTMTPDSGDDFDALLNITTNQSTNRNETL